MGLIKSSSKVLRNLDVDESGDLELAGRHRIRRIVYGNKNAAIRYLKVYDKATAPDENDTPVYTFILQATTTDEINIGDDGHIFENGIGVRATTGVADNDTGAPSANDVITHVLYE